MSWRVARSLERLRSQINALAPGRSKASDGTIGDAAHAHTKSDHNPFDFTPRIPDDPDVVAAMDITHDPAGGCDCNAIAASLVASRDPRIQYIIWDKRIINREQQPWVWRPYTGKNGHTHHLHISVDEKPALYDDARDWAVSVGAGSAAPVKGEHFDPGVVFDRISAVQERLTELGYQPGKVDGLYGDRTRKALNAFRRSYGLPEQTAFVLTPDDVTMLFRGSAQPDDPGPVTPNLSGKGGCNFLARLAARLRRTAR